MPGKRAAQARAQRSQELQQQVMRFADEYAASVREAIVEFQRVSNGQSRLSAQEWTVQQSQAAFTIASGANPLTNLLDMVVLASLSRMVMDDVWLDERQRTLGEPLRGTHVSLEEAAWRLAENVLNVEQRAELRDTINRWRAEHPHLDSVAHIRFVEFAKVAGVTPRHAGSRGNLFSLVGLDPFVGLDPAVREIAQTRELAERSIFYLQRTPALLDMQVERLIYEFVMQPEVQELLHDAQRVSLIGDASDRLVTMLPELLANERAAALAQLMQELDLRSAEVSRMAQDLKQLLQAGTLTAKEIDAVVARLDRLHARHRARSTSSLSAAKPINPEDYSRLLQEVGAAARELSALAQDVEYLVPAADSLLARSSNTVNALLDRLFVRAAALIVVATACILFGVLIVRRTGWRAHRSVEPTSG